MAEKNEAEDGSSISLKSEMRQTAKHPIFYMFYDEPKMQILFSSVP